jgi:hypothetical protein
VNAIELIAGIGLGAFVAVLALFFVWRQMRTRRTLRSDLNLAAADRAYLWQQTQRRLFNSFLMLLFAGMLVGGLFLTEPMRPKGAEPLESAQESLRLYTGYWIVTLLVLLAILTLAVTDLWATARFGFRHQKQLEQDRRAMLMEEAARIRRRRQELN